MIQHWEENEKFPPEKYYEACITYHIVRYCEEKQMGRIFPFGISQIQEKKRDTVLAIRWKVKTSFCPVQAAADADDGK